jgi:hypothetical protein
MKALVIEREREREREIRDRYPRSRETFPMCRSVNARVAHHETLYYPRTSTERQQSADYLIPNQCCLDSALAEGDRRQAVNYLRAS